VQRRHLLLVVGLLVALTVPLLSTSAHSAWFLCEFRGNLYNAGQDILHGLNPYRPGYIATQAHTLRDGGTPVTNFILPVYPAPALVAAAPLSLLPFQLAATVFLACSMGALLVSMRLLGVRDLRCVACMVVSIPVLLALIDGALTPLLVLGIALAWRYRDRVGGCAAAIAAVVVAKLFLWPLLLWTLMTRRLRALRAAVVIAAGMVLGGWAMLGFAGLAGYTHMLSDLNAVESGVGVSLVAALHAAGVSTHAANVLAVAADVPVLLAAWWHARRPGGDRRALALAVLAALTATPIAWPNYLVLVFVPIALLSPGFSPLWLVPLLGYLAPQTQTHGRVIEMIPYLVIETIVLAYTLRPTGGRLPIVELEPPLAAATRVTAVP
jgi:hypothetical protein